MRLRVASVSAVAVATIAALGAGCGSAGRIAPLAAPAVAPPGGSISAHPVRWIACDAATGPDGLQCATVRVPLDPADPARGSIGIALDRQPASGAAIGSLLEDPGGPGVSGVDFLPLLLRELPPSITTRFNVVGVDPPGVGRSDPVTCGSSADLDAELSVDPAPLTAAGFGALVAADRRLAAGCRARSGRILPYVSTVDAARDLDAVRAALGDTRLTYLGFSYGTLLGATYARLFPTRIRAMVLDGALDPALWPVHTAQVQAVALDHELQAFLASCSAGRCGWQPAGGPAAAFGALLGGVRAHPLVVAGTSQTVGPAAFLYGSADALYSPQSWPVLGRALAALAAGDGRGILGLFDSYVERDANGKYTNTIEAETAVDCLDAPAPSLSALQAAAGPTADGAPVYGLLDLYSEASCTVWPVPATGHPGPVAAPGSPPIVVVGSTQDPVTPLVWAQALAHELSRGVLLTRVGYGHTAYGFSSCIRAAVDSYLLTRVPPAPGTSCPSD